MAALDFPNSPAANQVFSAPNGVTYIWNGTVWAVYSAAYFAPVASPTFDALTTLLSDPGAGPAPADTPLQITQGTPVFSRSFTAVNAANPIEVNVNGMLGAPGAAEWGYLALFIDGAANAVAETRSTVNTNWAALLHLYWQGVLAAGAHTFMLRFIGYNATVYLNGAGGVRYGGGTNRTTMVIREIGAGVQGAVGPQGPAGPSGGPVTGPTLDTANAAVANSGTIPIDDTIPQVTEGTLLFTRSFTAVDPSHPIDVDVDIPAFGGTGSGGVNTTLALFIDGAANAVAVSGSVVNTNWFSPQRLHWRGVLAAGAHTFMVRWSAPYLNRNDTGRYFGGAMADQMVITEIGVGPVGPQGPPGVMPGAVNAQTGTNYVLTAGDANGTVTMNNAGANTVTVPTGLGANFTCAIFQIGAGQTSVVAGSGVTVNAAVGLKCRTRYSPVSVFTYAANAFIVSGDTSA
jgi:hypothetical protein